MSTTAQLPMLDSDDLGPADEALLDLLREGRVTAPFAADETGYSLQYVRDRLGRLVEHGNARKVYQGLYELKDDPRTGTERTADTEDPPAVAHPNVETDTDVAIREQLEEELPGSGEILQRRVDEIVKMYEFLREHGSAEKSDLLGVVDVEATGYQDENSVWSNMVKGRDTLRALPGVETPPTGRTEWHYE